MTRRHATLACLMGFNPTPPPRPRGTRPCAICLATVHKHLHTRGHTKAHSGSGDSRLLYLLLPKAASRRRSAVSKTTYVTRISEAAVRHPTLRFPPRQSHLGIVHSLRNAHNEP